jgi:hypothetical protein
MERRRRRRRERRRSRRRVETAQKFLKRLGKVAMRGHEKKRENSFFSAFHIIIDEVTSPSFSLQEDARTLSQISKPG